LPLGTEVPYAGRLRTSTVLQMGSVRRNNALGVSQSTSATLMGAALWSPTRSLGIDVAVPLAARVVTHDGVREAYGVGVGDVDVGGRLFLADRTFAPRAVAGLRLGARLPTTTWLRRPDGQSLPRGVQPGTADAAATVQLFGVALPTSTLTLTGVVDALAPLANREGEITGGFVVEGRAFAIWRAAEAVSVRGGGAATLVTASDTKSAAPDARQAVFAEVGVSVDVDASTFVAVVVAMPTWRGGRDAEGPRATLSWTRDW
jgi:hypothetical protein